MDTLKEICRKTGLHLYQQEKDYLIKLFLFYYFRRFDNAIFKGGTCLRYLYETERFSEDIDFNIDISPSNFDKQVEIILYEIEMTGINNGYIKKELFEEAYASEIWFYGPLYKGTKLTRNKFRIDAGKRGGISKKPRWELIKSEYPETRKQFLIKTMDENELIVEKIITMFGRKKGRDLYDVWFLLKRGLNIDVELLERKMTKIMNIKKYPSKHDYERDLKRLTHRLIPYEQVLKDVEDELEAVIGF